MVDIPSPILVLRGPMSMLPYPIRWRLRRLWPRFHRRFLCSRGLHSYPLGENGEGVPEVGKWWSLKGERVYAQHCQHCGHYNELARAGDASLESMLEARRG